MTRFSREVLEERIALLEASIRREYRIMLEYPAGSLEQTRHWDQLRHLAGQLNDLEKELQNAPSEHVTEEE